MLLRIGSVLNESVISIQFNFNFIIGLVDAYLYESSR